MEPEFFTSLICFRGQKASIVITVNVLIDGISTKWSVQVMRCLLEIIQNKAVGKVFNDLLFLSPFQLQDNVNYVSLLDKHFL